MGIKHIFFDLDHTLWDFDKNSALSFQEVFQEQAINLDLALFLKTYVPINANYWKLFREEKIEKEALRYGRLKDTFKALDYNISDALIIKIAEDYISYMPKYNELIEGAIEILDYLAPKYQLHIITNGFKEVQYLKLEKSGLKKYFNNIVTSECIGAKKPNSKIFEFALAKIKAEAQDCLMIGDSYEADVLGAFNFGISPIFFNINNKEKNTENTFITIERLIELKQYL